LPIIFFSLVTLTARARILLVLGCLLLRSLRAEQTRVASSLVAFVNPHFSYVDAPTHPSCLQSRRLFLFGTLWALAPFLLAHHLHLRRCFFIYLHSLSATGWMIDLHPPFSKANGRRVQHVHTGSFPLTFSTLIFSFFLSRIEARCARSAYFLPS